MPIYAYKCESCGLAKDVLQKMSDTPLTDCPGCGAPTFKKQLTAAGFQLKGSGWYVTDFKGGGAGATASVAGSESGKSESGATGGTGSQSEKNSAGKPAESTTPAAKTESAPAAPATSSSSSGTTK
jgi:putative FmdB family regulatory protein